MTIPALESDQFPHIGDPVFSQDKAHQIFFDTIARQCVEKAWNSLTTQQVKPNRQEIEAVIISLYHSMGWTVPPIEWYQNVRDAHDAYNSLLPDEQVFQLSRYVMELRNSCHSQVWFIHLWHTHLAVYQNLYPTIIRFFLHNVATDQQYPDIYLGSKIFNIDDLAFCFFIQTLIALSEDEDPELLAMAPTNFIKRWQRSTWRHLELLDAYIYLQHHLFGYLCHKERCLVIENPLYIKFERSSGNLHCADGPALVMADGFSGYFWKNIAIPSEYYIAAQHNTLHKETWLSIRNALVRSALMEIMGGDAFIKMMGSTILDHTPQGTLHQVPIALSLDFWNIENYALFVEIRDPASKGSTQRTYFLRVPPDCTTVKEAIAWTFELSADEYDPIDEA